MKTMFHALHITFIIVLSIALARAQVPDWENVRGPLSLPNSYDVGAVVSDGYGQQVVANYSQVGADAYVYHYLIDNNGATLQSTALLTGQGWHSTFSSVTSFGGTISIVAQARSNSDVSYVVLFQSTDGGITWPEQLRVSYAPSVPVTVVDAASDQNGVHIAWSTGTDVSDEVYYLRRNIQQNRWDDLTNITNLAIPFCQFGNKPKVITSGNRVIVSYVGYETNQPSSVVTRDGDMTTFPIQWESTVRNAALTGFNATAQSIAQLGNQTHVMAPEAAGTNRLNTSQRLDFGNWSTPTQFATIGVDEFQNHRRKIISYQSNLLTCYSNSTTVSFRSNDGAGWSAPYTVESYSDLRRSTLSASRMGTYVFWTRGQSVTHWMGRKVSALTGSITENMFWTGNNWLSGNSSIEGNYTVTMKSGSVSTFLSSAQLTVKAGATLIVEPNAQLTMGSGSKIVVENGATVKVLMNANLVIPSGGTLQANAGAQFKFNPGSGLMSYGQVNAYGAEGLPVSFVSVYGAGGTWSGMVLSGSGANNSTLQYAIVQNVSSVGGSAVTVVGATGVSILHCTISNNGTILTHGLSLSNAGSPEVAYNVINGNTGYGVNFMSTNGNFYKNIVLSNTSGGVYCSNASPSFGKNGFPAYSGNNNITGGSYGVNIQANSYPYIGSQQTSYYGYNAISGNSIARVYVNSSCGALAEQNWWGSSSPNPSWFRITNGCLDWQPFLTSDPFQQYNSPKGGPTPPTTTSLQDSGSLYRQAFEKRIAGDHGQAKGLLKAIFNARPSSPDALQAAIGLLYLYRENNDTDVFDFVQRGWQQHRANDPAFTLIVAKMLAQQSNVTETVSLLNRVASRNPNSEYAKQALLDLFYVYITRPQLHNLLPRVLQALQASYADDIEVQQAIWLYDRIGNSSSSPLQRSGEYVRSNIKPESFALSQNYPNPFNPTTTIRFHIPEASNVSLRLYDLLGREVATLVHEVRNAGSYDEMFDASQLASGVYIYKLAAGNFTASKKFLLVK